MKLLGKIVLTLLSLLLLASVILWILAKNINPETIKKLVSNQITALTHKQSHIDGTISWQLFPRPGLKFNKIIIGDAKLNEEYSLAIDTLLLNLKITPLLRGKFVFSEVNIDGLNTQVNLHSAKPAKSSEETSKSQSTKGSYGEQFAIERLLVSHGQVIINNNGHSTVFKNLQIGVEQFNLQNSPFTVQVKTKLAEYSSNPLINANINFKGRLSLAPSVLNQLQNGITQSFAEGQLLLQNVSLNQFVIKKVSATLKTNKEGIQFNPLTLSLYDGESIGNMDYTIATKQFSLNQTATNLNGKQLMAVLLGYEMISGGLDYSIHASIPVENPNIGTISGTGTISIKEGEIYNFSLEQLLNDLKEKLKNIISNRDLGLKNALQQLTNWDNSTYTQGNTAFKLASLQYQFQNGMLSSESILLQTDKLQVKGNGTLNLSSYELNSKLQASVNNNSAEPAMLKIQEILGGYFPLIISGTLEHPKVLPDFKAMAPLLGQQLMNPNIDRPVNQIRNRLKDLIRR
ncbi:AsmA family protein [Legionella maioricensis]|uniref:AsmA family protein n=1 Tax=Legionella maioricensis TaxID=2896528 RepID=A0A9X2IE97_9GAMM|nr:AsmA family protein [Legionella maioricensis]MCL9685598.1 AsmA family protein [Legionella maioricensis]MCL9689007.1 AsmA family protein [Legionella maioricensis]